MAGSQHESMGTEGTCSGADVGGARRAGGGIGGDVGREVRIGARLGREGAGVAAPPRRGATSSAKRGKEVAAAMGAASE